jgi:hypothetical protein
LSQQFPSILRSTLIVARRGRLLGELARELAFAVVIAWWFTNV